MKIHLRIYELWGKMLAYGLHLYYRNWCIGIMKKNHIPNKPVPGEDQYVRKWKQLSRTVDRRYYRLFSRYIGQSVDIVPEDISHNIVEHVLNPSALRPYYEDKNMFDSIFPRGFLPDTYLRCIQGFYYDNEYRPMPHLDDAELLKRFDGAERIFLKPAVGSSSGRGVMMFRRDPVNGSYIAPNGTDRLTVAFLKQYAPQGGGGNYIIQEALTQSESVSRFNPTSINTIRIATYRSVKTDRTEILAIIMRIGGKGSFVDNAHAGGVFIGVSQDGTLGKFAADQYGNRYPSFNGCDFEHETYRIPNFDQVLDFARAVGNHVIHHRLIAQDIALTETGKPQLVEFNATAFSSWLFQFTIAPAYGDFTDEIIEYCKEHKKEIRRVRVSVW